MYIVDVSKSLWGNVMWKGMKVRVIIFPFSSFIPFHMHPSILLLKTSFRDVVPYTVVLQGWINGQSDSEGKLHPTSGGLRIGKKLPERQPNDPYDDDQEWDRDGQYYHYITKWMHALNCVTRSTGDKTFNALAAEMVKGTHDKFTYGLGSKRMYWKMSIDLSRPQVHSMGHHDPLDG